jgi:two-component system osmolarity sensor histidine kinase EnvZ
VLETLLPQKISSRIIALVLFILISNALLTSIFSQQYHMQLGQAKTAEALHAALNYISIHGTPVNIDKVLDSYQLVHLEVPPSNIVLSSNHVLKSLSVHFNLRNQNTVAFYEDKNNPRVLYIAYKPINKPAYWLTMPQEPMVKTGIIIAYLEEILIVIIIFLGSYFTARTINEPLRKIMKSLRVFGTGTLPPPLQEEGPVEIKKLAHSVNQMIKDHYNLEKERELMLAGISHDLRTPLTRLQLLAEMSTASTETIDEMKEEIEQITKMQQQFIDYVSASNHENEDWISLHEFCNDLANKYKLTSQQVIIKNLSPKEILIKTQPIGLYRILTNGINNAIKYGDAPYCVEISENDSHVFINIMDSGEGVPDTSMADIFKPLFRGDTARKNAEGSGLGLAIVARIVTRLGGTISAHNLQPKGFCLRVVLPKHD